MEQIVFDGYSPQGKRAITAHLKKLSFRWKNKLYLITKATPRNGSNDVVFEMEEQGSVSMPTRGLL